MGTDGLTWFNELPAGAARQALLDCCSVPGWAELMAAARPYSSAHEAARRSGEIVAALTITDLADALAGHPRIGERPDPAGGNSRAAAWSRREQSGVDADDTSTRQALAEANRQYEQRFGHIYLVCASGLNAAQLLAWLRERLANEPAAEWRVVRRELGKINQIRLRQLLVGGP